MPDYLRDFEEVVLRGDGTRFRRDRLIKKIRKFGVAVKKSGGDVNAFPQSKLVEALCQDGHGEFRELMRQLCFARLFRGDFSDWSGWEYRNEWAMGSYSPEIPNMRWRLEPVRSLAVLGEQGLGDEIMFGSCLPDARVRVPEIVFECDPRLVDVFKRSLRIDCKPRQDIVDRGKSIVQYLTLKRAEEAFIPLGDLPRLFRKDKSHFPGKAFLKPLPEYVEKWKHLKGRTGIAWRSRTGQLDPRDFKVENPVLLQYDLLPFEEEFGAVTDCDLMDDIEDLFGICANLSRVVSVPQTIVHIAGAIGTRVDVVMAPVNSGRVVSQLPYRYTEGKMYWYPNVEVHNSIGLYSRSRPKS